MATTVTTNYTGDVLDNIASKLRTGIVTVQENAINVIENAVGNPVIPRIEASSVLQARAATPTDSGTIAFTEKSIPLGDLMVYIEVNPASFEQYWRPFQPQGQLLFRSLPQEVQMQMTDEVVRVVAEQLETLIWQGDTAGAASLAFFDGLLKNFGGDGDVIDVAGPVALTDANIFAKFREVWDVVPAAVKRSMNLKFYISEATADLYRNAQEDQANKGPDPTGSALMRYRQKDIIVSPGLTDDTIIATVGNIGFDSNLHFACDWDMNSIDEVTLFERVQPNSEMHFVKMLFKAGVQSSFGSQVVMYKV